MVKRSLGIQGVDQAIERIPRDGHRLFQPRGNAEDDRDAIGQRHDRSERRALRDRTDFSALFNPPSEGGPSYEPRRFPCRWLYTPATTLLRQGSAPTIISARHPFPGRAAKAADICLG